MSLLKLAQDDPQREFEFEINSSLQMTPNQRLEAWLDWNLTMLEFMKDQNHELRSHPQIVKH